MEYYVISDIHGEFGAFQEALERVPLEDENVSLILLGDYVDRGPDSLKVLAKIKELQDLHPDTIIPLLGNHDIMFLDWLEGLSFNHLLNDTKAATLNSFYQDSCKKGLLTIAGEDIGAPTVRKVTFDPFHISEDCSEEVAELINDNYRELISWLRGLSFYHEVDDVVFVHAGFDSELDNWKQTSKNHMIWQYPAVKGKTPWNIKVVAGHIMAQELHNNEDISDIIRFDDYIYIDGGVNRTKKLNILVYDDVEESFYDLNNNKLL